MILPTSASNVLPVPGGPYIRKPMLASSPSAYSKGKLSGPVTPVSKSALMPFKPFTASHCVHKKHLQAGDKCSGVIETLNSNYLATARFGGCAFLLRPLPSEFESKLHVPQHDELRPLQYLGAFVVGADVIQKYSSAGLHLFCCTNCRVFVPFLLFC